MIQTHDEAKAYLDGGRNPEYRRIAHATTIEPRKDGSIALKYHATDVVTWHPDGSITLNTVDPQGRPWHTVTSKKRMNDFQALVTVWQEDGVWYVTPMGERSWEKENAKQYADGMTIYPDGTIVYSGEKPDPDNL